MLLCIRRCKSDGFPCLLSKVCTVHTTHYPYIRAVYTGSVYTGLNTLADKLDERLIWLLCGRCRHLSDVDS